MKTKFVYLVSTSLALFFFLAAPSSLEAYYRVRGRGVAPTAEEAQEKAIEAIHRACGSREVLSLDPIEGTCVATGCTVVLEAICN